MDSPLKKYFLSQGILHQINTNARRKGDVNHLELTLMCGCEWDCVGPSPRVESLLFDALVISKWEIYYVTNLPSNLRIIPSCQAAVHSREGRRRRQFGIGEVDWVCWQLIISSTQFKLSSSLLQLLFSSVQLRLSLA